MWIVPTYSNLYHYGGNNPVRYVDPTGRWILTLTLNVGAGAGGAGTAGVGVAIGFSFKDGVSMGFLETHSVGAQQGASANVFLSIGFDPESSSVTSGSSESITIGGSGDMPIGAGIGGDIAIDLETGITSYSASISFGIGTPGEAHELFTTTNTITTEDLAEKIYQKMTPQGIRSEAGQQNSLMEENQ